MTAVELFAFVFVVLGAILGGIYGSRLGPGGQVAGIILVKHWYFAAGVEPSIYVPKN